MTRRFYEFNQNNSGGYWKAALGHTLWVEADNPAEANALAKELGVYFDGCKKGIDCECCGDRWGAADEWSAYDKPTWTEYAEEWGLKNKIKPYGEPLRDLKQEECE